MSVARISPLPNLLVLVYKFLKCDFAIYDLYVCRSQYFFHSTSFSYYLSLTMIMEVHTVKTICVTAASFFVSAVHWRSLVQHMLLPKLCLVNFFLSVVQGKLPYGATLLSTLEANDGLVNMTVLVSIARKKPPNPTSSPKKSYNLSDGVRLWPQLPIIPALGSTQKVPPGNENLTGRFPLVFHSARSRSLVMSPFRRDWEHKFTQSRTAQERSNFSSFFKQSFSETSV